jgi:ubiquinone/menaquinone biosynthesis C-methylase UbiE
VGLYSGTIFPWLMDRNLRTEEVAALRRQVLQQAAQPVLEIGFGTGLNLPCYPDRVRDITAIDRQLPRLRFVRKRIAESRVRVQFEQADAEKLPIPDGSIATVVTTWFLCSVARPAVILSEIRRVLRPDGRYLFIEHGLSPEPQQRRLQERLTPITRITACGCTLTRPVRELLRGGGFDLLEFEERDLPSLGRASGHLFLGAARSSEGG